MAASDSPISHEFDERLYLVDEDTVPRDPVEVAASRALAVYRESVGQGRPTSVEALIESAPYAAAQIRQAIAAFDLMNEATRHTDLPPPPAEATVWPRVPGYQIVRVLGEGGMGIVYAAVQESLQRPVAIKFLSPRLETDQDVISRFTREIQLLTRLTHPNVVDILDAGMVEGRHYYVMEYVNGLSLERILRKHRVRQHTAAVILKQIVTGLAAAHKQGILHRDLKPANILLDRNAVVRIVDFGLAAVQPEFRETNSASTQAGGRLGTMGYMSPEQLRDPRECTVRSDIYAVGVIFYQMLTGQLPQGSFPPASQLVPGTTSAVDRLIDRCLRTDPAERYPSCDSLLRSIGRLERRIDRTQRKLLRLHEQARQRRSIDDVLESMASGSPAEDDLGPLSDPDLQLVIDAWAELPAALRSGIVAIVRNGLRSTDES